MGYARTDARTDAGRTKTIFLINGLKTPARCAGHKNKNKTNIAIIININVSGHSSRKGTECEHDEICTEKAGNGKERQNLIYYIPRVIAEERLAANYDGFAPSSMD